MQDDVLDYDEQDDFRDAVGAAEIAGAVQFTDLPTGVQEATVRTEKIHRVR